MNKIQIIMLRVKLHSIEDKNIRNFINPIYTKYVINHYSSYFDK